MALRRQGVPGVAARLQRRALALDPQCFEAHANLGRALNEQGCFREALAEYRRALEIEPSLTIIASSLLLFLHADPNRSPDDIFAAHVALGQRYAEPLRQRTTFSQSRDPERRLRLGYVSRDSRAHPVAHFLEPVLASHDPAAFARCWPGEDVGFRYYVWQLGYATFPWTGLVPASLLSACVRRMDRPRALARVHEHARARPPPAARADALDPADRHDGHTQPEARELERNAVDEESDLIVRESVERRTTL